jgi:hypothetical protein
MKDFRYLPGDVYLVLAIWQDVSGVDVLDYRGASKLVKCVEVEVKGWQSKTLEEKGRWLYSFLKWLWMEGKKLGDGWRYMTKYVIDIKVENGVKAVVEAYQKYVKERFGKDVYVDLSNVEVVKAAKVVQKVAKELGVSVYNVIKYQHECWEEIKEPLVFQRMSDEDLVKRRIKVKMDEDRKQGVVRKDDTKGKDNRKGDDLEYLVAKYWKNMLSIGVMFYIRKKGWLAELAKEYWEELRDAGNTKRAELKAKYSVENVVKRWKEEGCPTNLLE